MLYKRTECSVFKTRTTRSPSMLRVMSLSNEFDVMSLPFQEGTICVMPWNASVDPLTIFQRQELHHWAQVSSSAVARNWTWKKRTKMDSTWQVLNFQFQKPLLTRIVGRSVLQSRTHVHSQKKLLYQGLLFQFLHVWGHVHQSRKLTISLKIRILLANRNFAVGWKVNIALAQLISHRS